MVDVRFREVVVDCADPPTLARWWSSFTGYTLRTDREDWSTIANEDQSMIIGFQKVPEGKVVKNRVHLDVEVDDIPTATAEAEALGATRVGEIHVDTAGSFQVLLDPEGNEWCVVSPA